MVLWMVTCCGPRSGRRSSWRNRISDHRVGPPFVRSLDIAQPAPGNTRVTVSPVSALPAVALSPRPKPSPPMPCTLPVLPPVLSLWCHDQLASPPWSGTRATQGGYGELLGGICTHLGAPRNQGCPSASSSHRSAKHREAGVSRWGRWEAAEGRRGVMGYWGPDGHWSLCPPVLAPLSKPVPCLPQRVPGKPVGFRRTMEEAKPTARLLTSHSGKGEPFPHGPSAAPACPCGSSSRQLLSTAWAAFQKNAIINGILIQASPFLGLR